VKYLFQEKVITIKNILLALNSKLSVQVDSSVNDNILLSKLEFCGIDGSIGKYDMGICDWQKVLYIK
jgi:hypothetical protein